MGDSMMDDSIFDDYGDSDAYSPIAVSVSYLLDWSLHPRMDQGFTS